jgi:hypothetical protein
VTAARTWQPGWSSLVIHKGGITGHVLCAAVQEGFSAHQPRQAAYARKMEPHPEETPDFTPFSKMRRIKLDPESVIGRELVDRFAEFDESFVGHSRIWAVVVKLIGLTAMCCKAVIDLEKQVIELRREVRSRDKP